MTGVQTCALPISAAAEIKARGNHVPMAEIADRAGVGIGTLYRHFPTREHLLSALTTRAFTLALRHARSADERPGPAVDAVGAFFAATIEHRDQLVLPLHGGPSDLDDEARRPSSQRSRPRLPAVPGSPRPGTVPRSARPWPVPDTP